MSFFSNNAIHQQVTETVDSLLETKCTYENEKKNAKHNYQF